MREAPVLTMLRKAVEEGGHSQWCATRKNAGCDCWHAEAKRLVAEIDGAKAKLREFMGGGQ